MVLLNLFGFLVLSALILVIYSEYAARKLEKDCVKNGGHFPSKITDLIESTTIVKCTRCGKILKSAQP